LRLDRDRQPGSEGQLKRRDAKIAEKKLFAACGQIWLSRSKAVFESAMDFQDAAFMVEVY
jgi:hypothetical protein